MALEATMPQNATGNNVLAGRMDRMVEPPAEVRRVIARGRRRR
jgi:hypothetical protein